MLIDKKPWLVLILWSPGSCCDVDVNWEAFDSEGEARAYVRDQVDKAISRGRTLDSDIELDELEMLEYYVLERHDAVDVLGLGEEGGAASA